MKKRKMKTKKYKLFFLITLAACVLGGSLRQNYLHASNYTTTSYQTKEKIVYITKTGKKYHLGSCRHLRYSKISINKENALLRGYGPCKACKP